MSLAVLAITVCAGPGAGSARADTVFLGDGAIQDGVTGGWDLPAQGTCPAGAANGYTGIDTRPECVALRLNIVQASCNSGASLSWTTNGVCNDLNNTTQIACQSQPDRLWNSSTNVCAIVMADDDRNNVTCAVNGGTWVTAGTCTGSWIMPARTAYTPPLLTGTGPGDQCLRCHNNRTQYNSPRVRDTEDTLYMGHKNMARKVTPGLAWGGPPFTCSNGAYETEEECVTNGGSWDPEIYPSDDSGRTFNWATGTINVSGVDRPIYWIFGDWLAALPRAIYVADPVAGKPGVSYACARCHTTGWTSDSLLNTAKEPEKSYPGITWDGITPPVTGQVNLAGGISNDSNKMASWDQFGITCARCHNSAVDSGTGTGSPPQYTAPAGMSSHHNLLTVPDINNGACTDTRWTAEAQCVSNGGQWLTACSQNPTAEVCTQAITTQAACVAPGAWVSAPAGWCSNAFYSDTTSCTTNGFVWQDGWCTRPDLTVSTVCSGGSGTNALTWRRNGTQASCQVASATWSFPSCSVEGYCNMGVNVTSKAVCDGLGGQFAYATDIIRCEDAGGHWTGNHSNRGQIITSLCMQCHRQESAGLPYGATSADGVNVDYTGTDPAGQIKAGPLHGSVELLLHHAGNDFLNSPHAQFTGKFNEIATAKLGTGYNSQFLNAAEAANTGNGCTGCHEVHTSTVAGTAPFRAECTECHSNISLAAIAHSAGPGTPMEIGGSVACESCHMPSGLHLWRINTDPAYSTIPVATALNGTVNANTSPDGSYTKAVWVDLDYACGQCHGGGTVHTSTTGSINAGSALLTVANPTGFQVGQRVRVTGAGSLYYDGEGTGYRNDFDSYVKAIAGSTITLAGNATASVTNAAVSQNPTTPGTPYYDKVYLATVAEGIHESAAVSYPVTFNAQAVPGTLTVNVNAIVDCGVDACPSFSYVWTWGDTLSDTTAVPNTSHTYTLAGTKSIKLDVKLAPDGGTVGSVTRTLSIVAPDLAPVAAGTCTWDANSWTMNVQDASADDGPDADALPGDGNGSLRIVLDWGDGSVKSIGTQGTLFSHVFITTGGFTVTHRAIDSKLQTHVTQCAPVVASYFSISGTVKNSAGANLGSAIVQVKKGSSIVKSLYTAANGTFTAGSLKPGSYTLTVLKAGLSFPVTGPLVIGPSQSGLVITANPPSLLRGKVKDAKGAGLGSALIQVMSGRTVVKEVRTAADGTFSVESLKPGRYTVIVKKRGYRFAVPKPIEIRARGIRLVIQALAP